MPKPIWLYLFSEVILYLGPTSLGLGIRGWWTPKRVKFMFVLSLTCISSCLGQLSSIHVAMQGGKAHIQWPDHKVVLHFIQSTGSSSFGLLKTQDLSMSTALLLLIIIPWLICLLPASSQRWKKLYLVSVYTMLPLRTQLIFSNKQWLSILYCFCWQYTYCGVIQVGNMNLCQTKRVIK